MSECEIIEFIKKGFAFAVKVAEQTGFTQNKNYENYDQARKWLENKLSEAAANEVSEMKRERKSQELLGGEK